MCYVKEQNGELIKGFFYGYDEIMKFSFYPHIL